MRDTYNLDELGAEVGALSEVQDLGLDGVLGVLQLSAAAYRSVYAPHPHGVSRTWRAQRLLPRRTCQKYRKQAMGRWLARGLGVWATGVSPSTCRACVRLRTEESGWDCGGCCGCQSCSQCALISGRVCWTPGKAWLTLIELPVNCNRSTFQQQSPPGMCHCTRPVLSAWSLPWYRMEYGMFQAVAGVVPAYQLLLPTVPHQRVPPCSGRHRWQFVFGLLSVGALKHASLHRTK